MLTVRIATLPLLEQRDLNLSDRIRYKQIYCVDGPPPPYFKPIPTCTCTDTYFRRVAQ